MLEVFDKIPAAIQGTSRQEDGEFITAKPSNHVCIPQMSAHRVGDQTQNGIPHAMTIGIIYPLEVIDIEIDHGQAPRVLARLMEFTFGEFMKGPKIGNASQ